MSIVVPDVPIHTLEYMQYSHHVNLGHFHVTLDLNHSSVKSVLTQWSNLWELGITMA